MATNGQPENEPQVFRLRRGLMTMPIAIFLLTQIIVCFFPLLGFTHVYTAAPLVQRWEFWVLFVELALILPVGCFLFQKAYSRRNAIVYTGSSLVQKGLLGSFELKLAPETKLAVYRTPGRGFYLQEFSTAAIFSKVGYKGIQLGDLSDVNRAELNRFLLILAPHIELTSGLYHLLNSTTSSGKPLVAEEFARKLIGEIVFKGVKVNPPFNIRLIFSLSLLGAFLVFFIAMVVSANVWKAFLVSLMGIVSVASLGIVGAVIDHFDMSQALIGSEGVGMQTSKGQIGRAIPYRLLGDLTYTVTESKGRTLATISSWSGEEIFRVFVIIESDDHLAQLEQAIQNSQPKLGTPLANEKRQ